MLIADKTVGADRSQADNQILSGDAGWIHCHKLPCLILFHRCVGRILIGKHDNAYLPVNTFLLNKLGNFLCQRIEETNHNTGIGIFLRGCRTLGAQAGTGEIVVLAKHIVVILVFIIADNFLHALNSHGQCSGCAVLLCQIIGSVLVDTVTVTQIGSILAVFSGTDRVNDNSRAVIGKRVGILGGNGTVHHIVFNLCPE